MNKTDALACEFAITLRGWMTADQWESMRAENARRGEDGTCASHDHVDANQAMIDAFGTIMGREYDFASEADHVMTEEAWTKARVSFMTAGQ